MRKLIFILLLCLSSCLFPGQGTVVYEKVGSRWIVKEVHIEMNAITSDNIEAAREQLEEYAK